MLLQGKNAIVTGGSQGIGTATSLMLAEDPVVDGISYQGSGRWVLEDHPDLLAIGLQLALARRNKVHAVIVDLARGRIVDPRDTASDRGLARAGFADDPQRLAAFEGEAHPIHRFRRIGDALEEALALLEMQS